MILARQVFQVKYGHMDEVLAAFKAFLESDPGSTNVTRILTDISGNNFTLVFETKAESVDAYWEALQASFKDQDMNAQADVFQQYIESGCREFYTIEYEG
jgi:hypothetical protein